MTVYEAQRDVRRVFRNGVPGRLVAAAVRTVSAARAGLPEAHPVNELGA